MKKIILNFAFLTLVTLAFAQQGINYKALITNNDAALQNSSVDVRFTILENGTSNVYEETHTVTTDANGIIILNIGEGSVENGSFSGINWNNEQFLKVEINTGNGYTDFGTTEFKYVPKAINSDKLEGKTVADIKTELDNERFNSILSRLDALESENANLTAQVNALQTKSDYITVSHDVNLDKIYTGTNDFNTDDVLNAVNALNEKTADMSIVYLNYEGVNYKTVRFSHVNLQVVNGSGYTYQRYSDDGYLDGAGLGNLIIGYNEKSSGSAADDRTGFNNLIVGHTNNYTSYGSVVFGKFNKVSAEYSTVTGGYENEAAKPYSSVSGGYNKSTPNSESDEDWFYWIGDQYHSN
ncbi:MAG: hypothetical protein GXO50_05030 [Chlorobi bacterium]|nr:hypothetical protein [Chlorobiota bacterium]